MTLLVDALVVGGGFLVGRWVVRSLRGRRGLAAAPPAGRPVAETSARTLLVGLPCSLGDVMVRTAEHDEAWLAGALVFSEDRPTAALFIAPEAGGDRGVLVRHDGADGVLWLAPLTGLALPADPPHVLEHAGARYQRTQRLPVKVARLGTGAPAVGPQAVVALYRGEGAERLLILAGQERTLAWRGVVLGEGDYEILPGDESTRAP